MFPHDTVDIYAIQGSLHRAEDAHHVAGDHVAILAACRAIYTEAKPVLYDQTKFCIHMRDQYWLHLWDSDAYEAKFNADASDAPDASDWIQGNPWLQKPRSIVPVSNVRDLSFDIECGTTSVGRQWTWTAQLKHTLLGATNIVKLHIALQPPLVDNDMRLDQHETDLILDSLKKTVKCRGMVTAGLALSLGSEAFNSKSYFKMLAGYKGIDKTYETTSRKMSELWSGYTKLLQELKGQTRVFRSKSEYRISFTQGQQRKLLDGDFTLALGRLDSEISKVLTRITTQQRLLTEMMDGITSQQEYRDALKEGAVKAGFPSTWPY